MSTDTSLIKIAESDRLNNEFKSAFSKVFLLTLLSLGWAPEAFSICSTPSNTPTRGLNLDVGGNIVVSPDAAIGSVIYSKTIEYVGDSVSPYLTCTGTNARFRYWRWVTEGGGAVPGYSDVVFPTSTRDVGVRVRGPNGVYIKTRGLYDQYPLPSGSISLNYAGETRMTFELIKLTPNASAVSLRGFSIPTIDYQVNEEGRVYQNFNASWQGDIIARASTCSLSDVNVNLGSHASSVFVNAGDKSPATPFVVNVNCARATPNVGIKIDPVFSTVNASSGIFSLDPGSSATGIGVQLMTQNGTPVNLDLPIKNSVGPATNFSFPLQAAFIKTGAAVRSGSARSSLRTTITYQ